MPTRPGTPGAGRCRSPPAWASGTRRPTLQDPGRARRRRSRAAPALGAARVLQRRVPLRRAAARRQRQPPLRSATRRGGATATRATRSRRRPGASVARRRLRQARGRGSDRADESGVPQTGPMNRILASRFETKQGVDFDAPAAGPPAARASCAAASALRDLRPSEARPAGLRADAAAALARRELQPVLGSATSRSSASAGAGSIVVTAAGPRPGRLVLRPGRRGHVRGLGRRRAPLPARPRRDGDRRLLDGRLRHLQARDAVPDLFARASRRSARPASASPRRRHPPGGRPTSTFPMLASLRNIPIQMWVGVRRRARPVPGTQLHARGFDDLDYRYEFGRSPRPST